METCREWCLCLKCQLNQGILACSFILSNLEGKIAYVSEELLTRSCGRWKSLCGGSGCGGSGGGNSNRWKTRLCVDCTESFRSQTAVRFEADKHCVGTGLHWPWHCATTEFTFIGYGYVIVKKWQHPQISFFRQLAGSSAWTVTMKLMQMDLNSLSLKQS